MSPMSLYSHTDHGQRPIIARVAFTLLYKTKYIYSQLLALRSPHRYRRFVWLNNKNPVIMDYHYKDTIAVPREYAITRNWLYKVKDQTIFALGQEFLMSTLYWIACHVDMKILRPSMNNVHILQRRVKYRNLFDIWRSTLKIGAAQDSLFLYRIP